MATLADWDRDASSASDDQLKTRLAALNELSLWPMFKAEMQWTAMFALVHTLQAEIDRRIRARRPKALEVWYAGDGRDYALMPDGQVWSVNAVGLEVVDIRWIVVNAEGRCVGDRMDEAALTRRGYRNVGHDTVVEAPGRAS